MLSRAPDPEAPAAERHDGPAPAAPAARAPMEAWDRVRLALGALSIVVACVAVALLVSAQQPDVYGGRVDVLFLAERDVGLDVRERELATQSDLLRSRAVLAPVAARAGLPLAELEEAVSVDVALSDLVRVTVADERPERARQLAQSIADTYLAFAAGLPVPPRVRLLTPAYVLDSPVGPSRTRAVAVGLLVGLQLAIVAVVLLARRRR